MFSYGERMYAPLVVPARFANVPGAYATIQANEASYMHNA